MILLRRIRRNDGFTLPEILAVMVILGLLAGLAFAAFIGQDETAMDAEAKSNARSLLWKVHSCFTTTEDYTLCDEPTEQEPPPGVAWGSAPGAAEVLRGADTTRYKVTIRARSRAASNGTNHSFTIVKEVGRPDRRTCETGSADDAGGCRNGVW
jgi:prepilin-type N-terminal cleavage/methylation domain-containing protein